MTTYSCIFAKKSMDKGAWWATVQRVAKKSDMIENNIFCMHICLVSHEWKMYV